ncbi:MAG TPA: hypothetical protein PKI05_14480, partial [Thermogutta sp.]|nr:hypothetical protein [Thermogutta sp.]
LVRGNRANNLGVFLEAICLLRDSPRNNPAERRTNRLFPSRRTRPEQAIVGPFSVFSVLENARSIAPNCYPRLLSIILVVCPPPWNNPNYPNYLFAYLLSGHSVH